MKHFYFLVLIALQLVTKAQSQDRNITYGPVQIFGMDEGAAFLKVGSPWQAITKGHYQPLESYFTEAVPASWTREYYLMVRTADNITGCGTIQFRFWFTWANKPGHQAETIVDWGWPTEGSYRWIKVPTVAQQVAAAGLSMDGSDRYWRIDGRINGCAGNTNWLVAKISGIYVMAVDKPAGTAVSVNLNTDPVAAGGLFTLGGLNNAVYIKDNKIGIGTEFPQAPLSVNGEILAKRVKVSQAVENWPDYVFHPGYKLPSLQALEDYISSNQHLPGIPAAAEIAKEGLDLGEMNKQLLQKMEEMTLYIIQQQKLIESQEKRIQQLEHKAQ